MDEAIRKFESYLNRRYPNSSTAKNYVNDLHIFARFADKPPRQVTKSDVAHFVEQQLAGGRAPTTINRRLASLHHFFEFLADETDDDTWANPVVWRQQRVKEGKPLPRDISDADVEQLWACIQHPRDRLMFGLMYGLGLRVGEVAALQVADLIPASDPRQGARLRVCGKGQKERVVPVPPPLVQHWAAWLAQRPQVDSDALFITRRKKGFSTRGIQERLAHYAQQAGVEVTCHQLRHTFGRRMAEGEMPLLSLAKLMGHEKVTTTQVYIAGAGVEVRADYEAAINRLDAERPGSFLSSSMGGDEQDRDQETVLSQPSNACEQARRQMAGDSATGARLAIRDARTQSRPSSVVRKWPDVSRFWEGLPAWLSEPLAEYIAHRQRRWKPSQAWHHTRNHLYALRQLWRWLLAERGLKSVVALQRRDVQAYIEARIKAGMAASTLNCELRILWAFLRFVEEQGQPISPGVFRVMPLKEGKPLPRFLSEEQYGRLQDWVLTETTGATRDDRLDRAWFYLLAHQGLRLCELCDLRVGDVDLQGRRLVIREGKWQRDRFIPLSPATVSALHSYLAVRGPAQTDHLLLYDQQPIKPGLIQVRLHRYGRAVEVSVSPRRLRHTLATRLLNAGANIVSIQRLLGHEKLETTQIYARTYDAIVEQDFYRTMARLEGDGERPSAVARTGSISLREESLSHIRVSVAK